MEPVEIENVSATYLRFAEIEGDARSPIYSDWARGIAADPDLRLRIASLPSIKRQPNLVFAAARFMGIAARPWLQVREEMLARWVAIRQTILTHHTQTNEAARMAMLLPAIERAAASGGTVALIEVGASAGLCLYPDRWSYDYGDGITIGDPDAPALRPAVYGTPPLPSAVPAIEWRAGLDLNPVDLRVAENVRWLEALIWPLGEDGRDDAERLQRLRTAIAIAKAEPVLIRRGDLRTDTAALIAEAKLFADTVIVMHSAVIAYLSAADRAAFEADMLALHERDPGTHWISNEGTRVVPGTVEQLAHLAAGEFVVSLNGTPLYVGDTHGRRLGPAV